MCIRDRYQRRVHGEIHIKNKFADMVKKKSAQENIGQKLAIVMRSGKVVLGFKSTVKSIRNGKAKMVLVSNNCPSLRKSQIDYYCMLGKIKVLPFIGTNNDLGTACGKLHRVSIMAILDAGDSDILNVE
eukprot:TRINITY_DN341_c0_g1_i8.p3 TRINITY_DN341_c0_g1~~TRINITY_DN341_c0_g1_i8.p3  ORF type:complete len:129 (+),score=29.61 TRINITY_DN341_c0_g1_i8:104-490(+)